MQKLILRDEFNNRDNNSIIFHHLRVLDYYSKHGGYNAIKIERSEQWADLHRSHLFVCFGR